MSLALDIFPSDVLSNIADRLPARDQNTLLYLSGCSTLRRRLIDRGVTHVTLTQNWVSKRGIEWLAPLRCLLSVSLTLVGLQTSVIRKFIASLPSSLLYLELNCHTVDDVIVSDDFETDPSLSACTAQGHRCWNVSASFPCLLSLAILIPAHSRRKKLPDRECFSTRFLSLLPQSLRHLEVSGIDEWDVSGGVWGALPPSLTCLGGSLGGLVPTRKMPESLRESLVSMDLCLHSAESLYWDEDAPDLPIDLPLLSFPPNLTRLSLIVASHRDFFKFDPFPAFPARLTALKLEGLQLDLPQIFSLLPDSVTNLKILDSGESPIESGATFTRASVNVKPNVKSLKLEASFSMESESEFYNLVLLSFPSLEICTLEGDEVSRGLEFNHLELLDPSRLRVLRTFMRTDICRKACLMFPKLTALRVTIPFSRLQGSFDFSAFPSSLTKLTLSGAQISFKDLELLPTSVKYFSSPSMSISKDDMAFFCRHYSPQNPVPQSGSTTPSPPLGIPTHALSTLLPKSHLNDAGELVNLEIPMSFGIHRSIGADGPSMKVYPLSQQIDGPLIFNVPTYNGLLPSTITDLRITRTDNYPLDGAWFSSETLPHLRSFSIHRVLPRFLQLGEFDRLETLECGGISSKCVSRCPPNLTRLKSRQAADLPSCFMPLPNSMREIICKERFGPTLTALPNDCSNLVSFVAHGIANFDEMSSVLDRLPPTLTCLGFSSYKPVVPLWLSNTSELFKRFPKLSLIELSPDSVLSDLTLLSLLDAGDVEVRGRRVTSVEAPDRLVELIGSLKIGDDGLLGTALVKALRGAMPRFKQVYEFGLHHQVPFLQAGSWSSIVSLMSPTLTSLYIGTEGVLLEGKILDKLPSSLTSLRLPDVASSQDIYDGFRYLPNLKDLTFQDLTETWRLEDIPRGVTRLQITGNRKLIPTNALRALPPGLIQLTLVHVGWLDADFEVLPATLFALELMGHNHDITPESIRLAQPSLKVLCGMARFLPQVVDAAKIKGMIFVGSTERF